MDEFLRRRRREAELSNDPQDIWRYAHSLEQIYGGISPSPGGIHSTQLLLLDLIRLAGFDEVADDLIANKNLWHAAIIRNSFSLIDFITQNQNQSGHISPGAVPVHHPLMCIRDLNQGIWNVDTLYVLVKAGQEDAFEEMIQSWNADEVDWYDDQQTFVWSLFGGMPPGRLIRIWWD